METRPELRRLAALLICLNCSWELMRFGASLQQPLWSLTPAAPTLPQYRFTLIVEMPKWAAASLMLAPCSRLHYATSAAFPLVAQGLFYLCASVL
jgi:hypothetical protein